MDNLVNAPGSGGLVAGGSSRGYIWTGSNVVTGVANLGADLRNDHPIGIEYCGGGITGTGTTVNGSCTDADFKGSASTPALKTASINSQQVFWVDSGTAANTRDKSDIILFTRDFSGTNRPSVECASCHDPHKAQGSDDVNFMRVTTAGSAICLACHTK
jgi:predicted CXXCH cytochrome family protein